MNDLTGKQVEIADDLVLDYLAADEAARNAGLCGAIDPERLVSIRGWLAEATYARIAEYGVDVNGYLAVGGQTALRLAEAIESLETAAEVDELCALERERLKAEAGQTPFAEQKAQMQRLRGRGEGGSPR